MHSTAVMQLPIPKAAKVFFLTVPKCAGTSVASFLSTLFKPEDICPGPSAGIWTYRPTEVTRYRLFQGHFDHDFIDGFKSPKIKLTILREPCSRLVSLYDFWRSYTWEYIYNELPPPPTNGPAVAKSSSFTDFLRTTNTFVRGHIFNSAARQILGAEFDGLAHDQNALIERCIGRLKTFDWVGITEEFQRSVYLLSKFLGVPAPAVGIRRNRTYHADASGTERVTETEPSTEESTLMRALTNVDSIIYNHAREMLDRQSTTNAATTWYFSAKYLTTCGAPEMVSTKRTTALSRAIPRRLLWIVNHRTLMPAEVPILRSLGWEVFVPKIVPENDLGFRSAAVTYEHDIALGLANPTLRILNRHNFYERNWPPTLEDIINRHFDVVVAHFSYYTTPLSEAALKFRGRLIARVFGREHPRTYSEFAETGPHKNLLADLSAMGDRFVFAQGYSNIADVESWELQRRSHTITVPLPADTYCHRDTWCGGGAKAVFLCPAIRPGSYYGDIYKGIKRNFGDLPHIIFGQQVGPVDDPAVLEYLTDEELRVLYVTAPVFVYPHTEPRHVHYSPLEAMVIGTPTLYLRGALIDKLTDGADLPGACRDVMEMRIKAQRLVDGDKDLAAGIRTAQSQVLQAFTPDLARQQWESALPHDTLPLGEVA